MDQRISGADSVSFRFMAGMSDSSNPYRASDIPGFGSTRSDQRSIFGLTYTHIFAPTVINEFRGALTRLGSHERNFNSGHDYTAELGLPSTVQDSFYTGYPRVVSRDYATLGDSSNVPNQAIVNVYQWGDTLTWVRKQHLLKFGGEILRSQFFEPENSNVRGVYNFQGKWTNSSFADLLLGLPNSTSRSGGVSPVYLFTTNFNLFAQDDYRVTSNLTLNLGIRYEITKPYDEKYGHMATFIPEIGKLIVSDGSTVPDFDQRLAATGLTGRVGLAGDYGLPHSLAYTQYHNFAPRVGFAWRPSLLKGTGCAQRLRHFLQHLDRTAVAQRYGCHIPVCAQRDLQPRAAGSQRAEAVQPFPCRAYSIFRSDERKRHGSAVALTEFAVMELHD